MTQPSKVLFLCTGNSCRSQWAEALANRRWPGAVAALSAGIEPKGVDPRAIKALAEKGVDIAGAVSKDLDALGDQSFDYVITLCANAEANCPFFPGPVKRAHAGFDDPPKLAAGAAGEEEAMAPYRRVLGEIEAFVENLPGFLAGL